MISLPFQECSTPLFSWIWVKSNIKLKLEGYVVIKISEILGYLIKYIIYILLFLRYFQNSRVLTLLIIFKNLYNAISLKRLRHVSAPNLLGKTPPSQLNRHSEPQSLLKPSPFNKLPWLTYKRHNEYVLQHTHSRYGSSLLHFSYMTPPPPT